jgi:hypothetical protein
MALVKLYKRRGWLYKRKRVYKQFLREPWLKSCLVIGCGDEPEIVGLAVAGYSQKRYF